MKLRLLLILLLLLTFSTITQAQPVEGCGTYIETDSCSWFEFDDNRFKIILPEGVDFPTGTTEYYIKANARYFCNELDCPSTTVWHCLDVTSIVDCASVCDQQTPGDVNHNEYIEVADVQLLNNYLAGVEKISDYLFNADANGDCVIDSFDTKRILSYVLDRQTPEKKPVDCTCLEPDTCSYQTAGDLDADALITYDDLTVLSDFLQDITKRPGYLANADVNGDCLIDNNDYEMLERYLAGDSILLTDCTCTSPLYHCDEQMPGDLNADGKISMPDIVFLRKYLSGKISAPTILANADPNGDCLINFGDLIYLNNFITNNGPPPVDCTCQKPKLMTTCCWGKRGNVDYDSAEIIDINDLVVLVNYMFRNGFDLVCFEEADLNGDGTIDISDLIFLINYLYNTKTGKPPLFCNLK